MKRSTVLSIAAVLAVLAVGSAYVLGVEETLTLFGGIAELIRGE